MQTIMPDNEKIKPTKSAEVNKNTRNNAIFVKTFTILMIKYALIT